MFTDIFWRFLILETFVIGILCTRCRQEHLQKQYCTSDYVFTARLRDNLGNYSYEVSHINKYKWPTKEPFMLVVKTDKKIEFKKGTKVIVFGHNKEWYIYAKRCPGIMRFDQQTTSQIDAIKMPYQHHCECAAEISKHHLAMGCEYLYSYMKKFNGKCFWTRTKDYTECKWRFYMMG